MQFNLERFVEMDLNTATYHELITLLNIGEVGAASIVMARNSLKRNGRKLTLVDLTLDCGIPGDIVKEWMVSGEIQPVPQHKDSGENEQTAVLLVSIVASIQALSEAVDIVNDRQALFESALKVRSQKSEILFEHIYIYENIKHLYIYYVQTLKCIENIHV